MMMLTSWMLIVRSQTPRLSHLKKSAPQGREREAKLEAKRARKDERGACWGAATSFHHRVAGARSRASWALGGARDTAFRFVASSSFKASRDGEEPGSVRAAAPPNPPEGPAARRSPPSPPEEARTDHGEPPVGGGVSYL